ncbi:TraM recognition domain-containing protein, partial [Escherichia coli]|uniref:TraM recognition domain-containing protein n=1 Tax=Escherichia coli TaxID=562 RepID=UPI0034D6A2D4
MGFFDEAGSYVTPAWSRMFEQSRSARLVMMPAIQTIANLDAVSSELLEMVLGNTVVKVSFRIGTEDTAEH